MQKQQQYELEPFNLMGTTNGRRVSVKYKKGKKERMVHFWPEKHEKWRLSPGYIPHHMKNLKMACKLFLEAYAYPKFVKGGSGSASPSLREWSTLFQNPQTKAKNMQRFLKILYVGGIEIAKNGRRYRTVKFEADTRMPDGTRTIWDFFKDGNGNEFKADGLWAVLESGKAKEGSMVEGQIASVATYPYTIHEDKPQAKKWTGVVFGHEDVTDYINKQLKSSFSCVMYGDTLTAPDQINKPATAGAPTSVQLEAASKI